MHRNRLLLILFSFVMVIPDLDLVVGFTGGAYGEFAKWYKWQLELVPQFIIPAATTKRSE